MGVFKELYVYRELLKSNVKKEIRGRYKGSFLGVLWSFVNPLLSVLVYAIVFPFVLKVQEENYVIYLIIAVIPWNYFTTSINQGTTTILSNAGIIKKVYFPREILPVSVVTSGLVNFFISCLIIFMFLIFSGLGLTWLIVFIPVIAIIQYMFTLGFVFVLSAINIYIKDVEYIMNFVLNMMFYATPIIYAMDIFPPNFQWIVKINPMAHIINAYRDIFYFQVLPPFRTLGVLAIASAIVMVIGYFIFKHLEKGFAEEV